MRIQQCWMMKCNAWMMVVSFLSFVVFYLFAVLLAFVHKFVE